MQKTCGGSSLVDSPCNGLTMCSGSMGSDPRNDIPAMVREFGAQGRIHFAHVRNIKFTGPGQFEEAAHFSADGSLDLYEIMKAFYEVGFDGYIRPDHGRMIWDEQGRAGYGLYDRALGAVYLSGLWEALGKDRKQVDRALTAGAQFIVSPGFNPDTVTYGLSKGALMIPGTATPGEMEQAMALGLDVVKFFPAEQNGGVAKLKALAGPYKTLKWMPTGGVNAKILTDYLSFDQIVACGGTWMVKGELLQREDWDEVTRLGRQAVHTMLDFSLDHIGINCQNEEEAAQLAQTLCAIFGFTYREGNSSVQALHAVECTKTPGRGEMGHIAIATCNVDRAVYHLSLSGIRCLPETRKTDAKGNTTAIYIDGDFGGFAIHLLRK